ncbi:outer membrane protein assembly factor BamC [Neisseria leonii]|uniref:Outer membrane protein assembly factor BamC n=1 Tax=Neisseria leonii TaxID=2995413 RepID=A0A9X4IBU0_9NEIS|nr:outer membrane protein assembly factor BamC [Neisseria sp. 51.81]MDD9328749.1 outer membrane protein assembly factor BamC [Neisseria sp. 51.81]
MNRIHPAVWAAAALALSACAAKSEQPKLDYQTHNRQVVDLSIPPDLTNPAQGNLYQLPAGSGAVRASDINRTGTVRRAETQTVLQKIDGVRLEREGSQRWLTVSGKTPAEIWPLLKAFWQENGFIIQNEEPAIGQMETEWAENRAKLPADGLRSLFEKVGLGGVYSTSERDKFLIRVERGRSGSTDIFFAHKGMQEVYTGKSEDTTMWQPRPNDPNLEAAFLSRFMQYLGMDEKAVAEQLQSKEQRSTPSDLARIDGSTLILSGDYQRNWRRTALALDRIGLTVVGQNAERNAFLVQPAPDESEAVRTAKPGLIARVFGSGKTTAAPEKRPELIAYVEPLNNGSSARISILNTDGSAYRGRELSGWISRLHNELR